jgi:hypothetical protein
VGVESRRLWSSSGCSRLTLLHQGRGCSPEAAATKVTEVAVELSWFTGHLRLRPGEQVLALRTPDELMFVVVMMDGQLFRKRCFAGDSFGRVSQGDRLVWTHMQRLLRLIGFTCR